MSAPSYNPQLLNYACEKHVAINYLKGAKVSPLLCPLVEVYLIGFGGYGIFNFLSLPSYNNYYTIHLINQP